MSDSSKSFSAPDLLSAHAPVSIQLPAVTRLDHDRRKTHPIRLDKLGHTIRRHQPKDIPLYALIQLDHRLQLTRMQRVADDGIDMPLDARVLVGGDLSHVRDELAPEAVVDIELAGGGGG